MRLCDCAWTADIAQQNLISKINRKNPIPIPRYNPVQAKPEHKNLHEFYKPKPNHVHRNSEHQPSPSIKKLYQIVKK